MTRGYNGIDLPARGRVCVDPETGDVYETEIELRHPAVEGRPENAPAFRRWIAKWAPRADAAALALGGIIAGAPEGDLDAAAIGEEARQAREVLLDQAGLGDPALAATG